VVYYSNFLSYPHANIIPFKGCERAFYPVTVGAEGHSSAMTNKIIPLFLQAYNLAYGKMENMGKLLKLDMELESSDGKRVSCHKCILSCKLSGSNCIRIL